MTCPVCGEVAILVRSVMRRGERIGASYVHTREVHSVGDTQTPAIEVVGRIQ